MNRQRRDFGEAPPKFPTKPVEKAALPKDYGNLKGKQKRS